MRTPEAPLERGEVGSGAATAPTWAAPWSSPDACFLSTHISPAICSYLQSLRAVPH